MPRAISAAVDEAVADLIGTPEMSTRERVEFLEGVIEALQGCLATYKDEQCT